MAALHRHVTSLVVKKSSNFWNISSSSRSPCPESRQANCVTLRSEGRNFKGEFFVRPPLLTREREPVLAGIRQPQPHLMREQQSRGSRHEAGGDKSISESFKQLSSQLFSFVLLYRDNGRWLLLLLTTWAPLCPPRADCDALRWWQRGFLATLPDSELKL